MSIKLAAHMKMQSDYEELFSYVLPLIRKIRPLAPYALTQSKPRNSLINYKECNDDKNTVSFVNPGRDTCLGRRCCARAILQRTVRAGRAASQETCGQKTQEKEKGQERRN